MVDDSGSDNLQRQRDRLKRSLEDDPTQLPVSCIHFCQKACRSRFTDGRSVTALAGSISTNGTDTMSLPAIDVARWECFWWTFDHRRVVATKLAAQITGREFQLRVRVVHDLEGKGSDGVDYTEKMTTTTAGRRIAVYDTEGHCWPVHFSEAEKTSQILLDIVRKGVLL